ncbi:MAG: C1 family peptidase, partial [Candidatus Cyclobacteriaceae bacterium M3_2C_046]
MYSLSQLQKLFTLSLRITLYVWLGIFTHSIYAQQFNHQSFKLSGSADQVISINRNINQNIDLQPFGSLPEVGGVTVSANITFHSDSSLVRLILIDKQSNEHLIFEAYPLMAENYRLQLDQVGLETVNLNQVQPDRLKLEVVEAEINLKSIMVSLNAMARSFQQTSQKVLQQTEIINLLNQKIAEKGQNWVAGATSVSSLSYQEKKQFFGGKVPNLQGFDYYVGGVFEVPSGSTTQTTTSPAAGNSPYVDQYNWRDRHGQDWLPPVTNQGGCGSCWAFAATGVTEFLVNLYYNRKLDLDLSEQHILSCSNSGTCEGGSPFSAFNYIRDHGIVNESCFPYAGQDLDCSGRCSNPQEVIKIGGWTAFNPYLKNEEDLKSMIIKGPVSLGIRPWWHTITMAGYKTVKAGDRFYVRTSDRSSWVNLEPGDPLIGRTAWYIKNSWGTGWGDQGFAYVVTNLEDIYLTAEVYGPVSSLTLNDGDILCQDLDGDGFYNWGIGPKPAHCPACPDQPDGDDSDPFKGPMDEYGHIMQLAPTAPDVINTTITQGESGLLKVAGENIRWYRDEGLTQLVHQGNQFSPNPSEIGLFYFYVTQTIANIESAPNQVTYKVIPTPPEAEDVFACENAPIPELTGQGQNIKWYEEAELLNMIHQGESLSSQNNTEGVYEYYLTQTIANCESLPAKVVLNIRSQPSKPAAADQSVCTGIAMAGLQADGEQIKWYAEAALNNLLHQGDTYNAGKSNPGSYTYFATQTISGCESPPEKVSLTIKPTPAAPTAQDQEVCEGSSVPALAGNGENLQWYAEAALNTLLHEGKSLITNKNKPGEYAYFATQIVSGCESPSAKVSLTIKPTPAAPTAQDQEVCEGSSVPALAGNGENLQWY